MMSLVPARSTFAGLFKCPIVVVMSNDLHPTAPLVRHWRHVAFFAVTVTGTQVPLTEACHRDPSYILTHLATRCCTERVSSAFRRCLLTTLHIEPSPDHSLVFRANSQRLPTILHCRYCNAIAPTPTLISNSHDRDQLSMAPRALQPPYLPLPCPDCRRRQLGSP